MKSACVLGLGYIGLPTASVLASNGFSVLGVDVDSHIVETVNAGDIHIEEPGLHTLVSAAIGSGNLRAACAPGPADVFFIAVPTPLTGDKHADMTYVEKATESILPCLAPGSLVILESTSPPGTCRDLVAPILQSTGLEVGRDVYLAHCPERVLPGKILKELIENDRVIGGSTPECARRARDVYATFLEGEMFLTDVTTAEMVKIVENTFRDVNIALANETALLCEEVRVDFWEVARLANRHPRVNVHSAGPGVGGHCISVDPWFLVARFPQTAELIRLARRRNDGMPAHVVRRTLELLSGVADPRVAALGLAFKGNVDDVRESPSIQVVDQLRQHGVHVAVHDSYVKSPLFGLVDLQTSCTDADCLLLLTDHSDYKDLDPHDIAQRMRRPVLLDTRNLLDHPRWRLAGFRVEVLGCGRQADTPDP